MTRDVEHFDEATGPMIPESEPFVESPPSGTTIPMKIVQNETIPSDIVATVRRSLAAIADGSCTGDDILNALQFADKLKEITRTLTESVKDAAARWIERNGELSCGTVRYYVAIDKTTKCMNNKDCMVAILSAAGGDMDVVAEALASDAFKPGYCKKILGPDFARLFTITEKPKLREDGTPRKTLQVVDERFTKR